MMNNFSWLSGVQLPQAAQTVLTSDTYLRDTYLLPNKHLSNKTKRVLFNSGFDFHQLGDLFQHSLPSDVVEDILSRETRVSLLAHLVENSVLTVAQQVSVFERFKRPIIYKAFLSNSSTNFELSEEILAAAPKYSNRLLWLSNIAPFHLSDEEMLEQMSFLGKTGPHVHEKLRLALNNRESPTLAVKLANSRMTAAEALALLSSKYANVAPLAQVLKNSPDFKKHSSYIASVARNLSMDPDQALVGLKPFFFQSEFSSFNVYEELLKTRAANGVFYNSLEGMSYESFMVLYRRFIGALSNYSLVVDAYVGLKNLYPDFIDRRDAESNPFSVINAEFQDSDENTWKLILVLLQKFDGPVEDFIRVINKLK